MKQQSEPMLVVRTQRMPLSPPSFNHNTDIFGMQNKVGGTVCAMDVGYLAAPFFRLEDGAGRPLSDIPTEGLLVLFQRGFRNLEVL
jgi:hypothetical protein